MTEPHFHPRVNLMVCYDVPQTSDTGRTPCAAPPLFLPTKASLHHPQPQFLYMYLLSVFITLDSVSNSCFWGPSRRCKRERPTEGICWIRSACFTKHFVIQPFLFSKHTKQNWVKASRPLICSPQCTCLNPFWMVSPWRARDWGFYLCMLTV